MSWTEAFGDSSSFVDYVLSFYVVIFFYTSYFIDFTLLSCSLQA